MKKMNHPAISSGLAMFSMFFGAGNITFPLLIGMSVTNGLFFALIGLILTAVFIPFSGLVGTTLFEGNYKNFFNRIGKIPGMTIILILIALIGPFGGIPRCMTLTYSTLKIYFPHMSLLLFSILGPLTIFLFSWKKNKIIDLIGYVLTPLLLFFLISIIIKGLFFSTGSAVSGKEVTNPFVYGLIEGYNTMDLLASFFFSSLVYQKIKSQTEDASNVKKIIAPVLKASLIGASLLSTVYIGFSYVAANYSAQLEGIVPEQLLGSLGHIVLGPYAGFFVCMSIALTCLTTAIALTVICAEFLKKEILKDRISYLVSLILILLTSVLVSTLGFSGIVRLLSPVLQIIYPALLVLSFLNIMHKLFAIRSVKLPVFSTATLMLLQRFL